MAINRIEINGYGQIELNNVAFRRDGRIEAQCALDSTDFASTVAENGMILAIDPIARKVKLPTGSDTLLALNYTTEHIYDERTPGYKDYFNKPGGFYPRLGYLSVGDKFTTNTVCYDTTDYANMTAVKAALTPTALGTTAVYAIPHTSGAWKLTTTKPTTGVGLQVRKGFTMPDGQYGIQFVVIVA